MPAFLATKHVSCRTALWLPAWFAAHFLCLYRDVECLQLTATDYRSPRGRHKGHSNGEYVSSAEHEPAVSTQIRETRLFPRDARRSAAADVTAYVIAYVTGPPTKVGRGLRRRGGRGRAVWIPRLGVAPVLELGHPERRAGLPTLSRSPEVHGAPGIVSLRRRQPGMHCQCGRILRRVVTAQVLTSGSTYATGGTEGTGHIRQMERLNQNIGVDYAGICE